ncbi:sodium-dependent transporter bedraggled [Anopheles aquasalis]|uniref:sodium-dependent transporter bedraggled n=1 Tax=Anopheles aquasalis TaxID=42839 RepID=UPI00215A43C8|nr:sodium-dependent transporter bedraggled [Anopheles aquasalis]
MATSSGSPRAAVPANHLTRSRSTVNSRSRATMAQNDYYCTLPRPSAKVPPHNATDECETGRRVDQESSTGADVDPGTMGNRQTIRERLSGGDPTADQAEARRSLLYEQNMCTFENFCERRNSQQRLQSAAGTAANNPSDHPGRPGDVVEETEDESADGLGNFCTLRRPSRRQEATRTTTNNDDTARYCTLKRKKLQLNRKFVESFLEDPNAKVADYLSELDAYLDEIDDVEDDDDDGECVREDETASDVTSVSIVQNEQELHEEVEPVSVSVNGSDEVREGDDGVQSQSLQYYQRENDGDGVKIVGATELPQDHRIQYGDIKHFCTLPKQKRTQVLSAFKRGASLRRTFVAPVPPSTSTASEAENRSGAAAAAAPSVDSLSAITDDCRQTLASGSAQSDESSRRAVHASWHRNSMRRKHLIELPEQPVPEHSPGGEISDQPDDDFCSISTLPADEQLIPRERSERTAATTYSVPSLLVALPPSPTPTEEQPHSSWEPSAPPTSSPSPAPPAYALETDLDDAVCTRPRQTGRRAQSQPRLVSITAVRDESTNELIIRTNSVPGNASAPPLALALEEAQLQQQQQQQQQRERYDGVESEGSSMGSSRNPSPVSLLSSTTTYSSIGSATDQVTDGGDRRTHARNQEPAARDGTIARPQSGSSANGEVATITASANGSRRDRASMTEQWRTTAVPGTTTAAPATTTTTETSQAIHEPDSDSDDPESDSSRRSSRRNDGRPKARWPLAVSRPLATVFCTLGLFNISRFAVFSVHFGANFVVQFLIFSLLFGIPMMWLQMVLGARIRGGPVTMWRISPICKGIGIALLIAQTLIALYSAISLAWVLVYFRDAFTMRNEKYRWQEPFEYYRGGGVGSGLPTPGNQSYRLSDTVADYFNGVVLQRYHLRLTLPGRTAGQAVPSGGAGGGGAATLPGVSGIGAIRFQLAFNLAILWTLVFVALCRGIRSLGKVVIGLFLFATAGLVAVAAKFLTFINYDSLQNIFPATDWQDFFLNSRSWMSAAQETFLTWGLLGVSVYSLSCRSNRKGACNSRTRRELRRDAFLVAFITLAVLMFAAILGSACVQILNTRGYYYFPGSYENLGTNVFLLPASQPLPPQHATMPNRWLLRYSMVVGESFKRPYADPSRESGYQVLRLVTELLPASLAAASHENIAPVWGLIGYLTLLLFGLGQLCVMWKPISGAFGDAPSSILLSCVTGLLLGMPMATEGGITIVYYLDTLLGAAWWLLLLWIGHILALFLVRGRPFTSDILVNDLKILQSLSAFVAFAWNFLLPIGLIILCILQYRLSNSAALFNWTPSVNGQSSSYWPLWARQTGGFVQVSFLLLVPIVIVVQIYRYLCSGPPDILDRVDLLLRPPVDGETSNPIRSGIQNRRPAVSAPLQSNASANNRARDGSGADGQGTGGAALSLTLDGRTGQAGEDDAPPKYTPPPSYTTATGARIAKMLRNSIRRSVRRLMGETSGGGTHRQRAALPPPPALADDDDGAPGNANPASGGELPPDYCSVLQQFGGPDSMEMARPAAMPRMLFNSSTLGSGSRRYRSLVVPVASDSSAVGPPQMTASDVRQILRPATVTGGAAAGNSLTLAPGTSGASAAPGFTQTLCNTLLLRRGHSMENLVLGAAPIGDSSIITLNCDDDDDDEYNDDDGVPRQRPRNGTDSVI